MDPKLAERWDSFQSKIRRVLHLRAILSLLRWDEEVYMPVKGAQARALQLRTLSEILHQYETSEELGNDLAFFADHMDQLNPDEQILVNEVVYDYQRAKKIPASWVGKFAETCSRAYHSWVQARQGLNFKMFQSELEEIISLCREKADLLGYEGSPYNALLEDYERGMDVTQLDSLFAVLESRQSELFKSVLDVQHDEVSVFDGKTWDTNKQWSITLRVLESIGFDFEAGRQDCSVHPFTTNMSTDDVRITTRLNPQHLFSGLFSSLHEGGHALYEQGFNESDKDTWLAQAPSLGIHESQSRLWENCIGRSYAFCKFLLPLLQEYFPEEMKDVTPEVLYREVNRVKLNFIRVEADECSYNLHIILRYRIEKDLIEGQLHVSDIPDRWNELFEQMFGVRPPNDALGCLQDIHWSHGSFGYFPTYALGNIYAGQLFERLQSELDIDDLVSRGEFTPIRLWLKQHVFNVGKRKLAKEIVESATQKPVSAEPFLHYLQTKYKMLTHS